MQAKLAAIEQAQSRDLSDEWAKTLQKNGQLYVDDELAAAYFALPRERFVQILANRLTPEHPEAQQQHEEWEEFRRFHLLVEFAGDNLIAPLGPVHASDSNQHVADVSAIGYTGEQLMAFDFQSKPRGFITENPETFSVYESFGLCWKLHCAGVDELRFHTEFHDNDFSRWANRPLDAPERWSEYGPNILDSRIISWKRDAFIDDLIHTMIAQVDQITAEIQRELSTTPAEPFAGFPDLDLPEPE